jgi:hypothetical protein
MADEATSMLPRGLCRLGPPGGDWWYGAYRAKGDIVYCAVTREGHKFLQVGKRGEQYWRCQGCKSMYNKEKTGRLVR